MIEPKPITLEHNDIRLEPMKVEHALGLEAGAADGELWNIWYANVPEPGATAKYVDHALKGLEKGIMLPWVVRDLEAGSIVGTTRYHDIVASIDRVEIGYTWYAKSRQRSHVNTTCKLMLMEHAF